jgi:hypothetical protein
MWTKLCKTRTKIRDAGQKIVLPDNVAFADKHCPADNEKSCPYCPADKICPLSVNLFFQIISKVLIF